MSANRKQPCSAVTILQHVLILVLLMPSNSVIATELAHDDKKQRLNQLQTRINHLQLELEQDNKNKNAALNQLKQSEKSISQSSAELTQLDQRIKATRQKLSQLEHQQHQYNQEIDQHKAFLAKQIQAAYVIGKQEYIKLLLNQQDPATVSRMATYYQYFTNARVNHITAVTDNLALLNTARTQVDAHNAELRQIRQQVVDHKTTLEQQYQQRKQIVATLAKRMQKKDLALKVLLHDEEHLKKLLQQLQNDLSDVDSDLLQQKDFRELKGLLPWPTPGKITARFGTTRHTGQLKWKGMLIATKPGKPIHAIARGRVVFADWLRGFGMLMILDHGKGYMSLYGHNESLYKNLGDWVNAGDVIATAGSSGGQKNSNLYFEIRYNGKPQNPKQWCQAITANLIPSTSASNTPR